VGYDRNELDTALRPGRIMLDRSEVKRTLSSIARSAVHLPRDAVATTALQQRSCS
jgi:hypothetical protein